MSDFKVTRYKLRASGMSVRGPEEPFSIVFLSDLHNKSYGKGNERLLQEIRNQDPEAVLIGGDLLTSADPPQMEAALDLMKELTRWYPIYAVNGNHEQRFKGADRKVSVMPMIIIHRRSGALVCICWKIRRSMRSFAGCHFGSGAMSFLWIIIAEGGASH